MEKYKVGDQINFNLMIRKKLDQVFLYEAVHLKQTENSCSIL